MGQAGWGDVSGRSGGSDDVMWTGGALKSNESGGGCMGVSEGRGYTRICSLSAMHQ